MLREPVLVTLHSNHRCAGNVGVRLSDLRDDIFICMHHQEGIGIYDMTMTVCRMAAFVPKIEGMSFQISIVIGMAEPVSAWPSCRARPVCSHRPTWFSGASRAAT